MKTVTIEAPETESLVPILKGIDSSIEVRDAESDGLAKSRLKEVRGGVKMIKGKFAPVKKHASDAHKAIVALEREVLEPWLAVDKILSGKILDYQEKAAEVARLEAKAAEEATRKRLEEARIQEAIHAEETGDTGAAEEILSEEPDPAPYVAPEPDVAKVEGFSTSETWAAEGYNIKATIAAIAGVDQAALKRPDLVNLLTYNKVPVNQMARALRAEMKVPGIRAFVKKSTRVR